MYGFSEVATNSFVHLQIPNTMAAETIESGVCEALSNIHHRAYRTTNVAAAADFIQNLGTGTVVDLGNGLSASS